MELPKIASIGGNCTLTYLTQLKVLNMPELVHLGGAFTWNYLTAATTFAMPKVPSLASFSLSDSSSAAMLSSIDLSSLERYVRILRSTRNFQATGSNCPRSKPSEDSSACATFL